jgi:hypothetical protein
VDERKVAVEHNDVVGAETGLRERSLPIVRLIDRHTLPAKPARERRSEMALVLGNEDANHRILTTDRSGRLVEPELWGLPVDARAVTL